MVETQDDRASLFNEISEEENYPRNDKWQSHLLDQYKLYVEMADRISQRRATANTYFLSLNSAILGFVGYLSVKDSGEYSWLLASGGVALSWLWRMLITSYSNISAAKFAIIHRIEKRLAIRPYEAEWEAMGRGSSPELYRHLGRMERGVPLVFIALHLVVFVRMFPWCWLTYFRVPAWPGCTL